MKPVLAKLINEVKQFKANFLFALGCMFLSGFANILPSWFIKVSIDGVGALNEGETNFSVVPTQIKDFSWVPNLTMDTSNIHIVLPVLIVSVFALSAVLRFLYEYNVRKVGLLVVRSMREKFHWHLSKLSLSTQMKYDSGSLVSRITSDMNQLQQWVSECLTNLFNENFKALFLFSWLLILDWKLTLISMIVIPLFALPVLKLGKRIRRYSRQGQDFIGGLTTFIAESLQNQRVTKAYNLEKKRQDDFITESDELYEAHRKWVLFMAMVSPTTNVIASIGIAVILFLGLSSVTSGFITIGEFSSFFVTSILLYDPVKRIGRVATTLQSALGVAERIYDVLDEDEQVDSGLSNLKEKMSGEIIFKDVCYSYNNPNPDQLTQRVQLFDHLNLEVKAKTSIALVGPSGSGKTTLVSLIPRFFEIESGEVLIDRIDIRDMSLNDLRSQIALVTQDSLLFTGTIRENIMLSKPEATEEEFLEATRKAHVAEFAEELELGYDSDIGERGQLLSVGQRQRLSLARAFISDAPIMLLDEPTSALDNESESLVYDAITKLMENRTVFIIAHRLNTIKNCDRILYIQEGKVVESGTHDELVQKGGSYSKLLQEV